MQLYCIQYFQIMSGKGSYCAVYGCSNLQGRDESSVRAWIRWHSIPSGSLGKQWKGRMFRDPAEIGNYLRVCSDHFADEDYDPPSLLRANYCYTPAMHIVLKKDAIRPLYKTSNCFIFTTKRISLYWLVEQLCMNNNIAINCVY